MRHRHARAGACAVITTVGALVLTALPGSAAAQIRPDSTTPRTPHRSAAETLSVGATSDAVYRAMQRDLGLNRAQAERRLANEAEAGAVAGHLKNALGTSFAGAWVSGTESGTLTVATTDTARLAAVRAAGARAVHASHSLAQLDAAKVKLDRAAQHRTAPEASSWAVDVRTNTVQLRAADPAAARTFVASSGADRSLVNVGATAERPRPLYDLRGGDAYYMGGGRCSVGFPITRGSQQGFATAGHCGRAGTSTTGYNQVAQGSFQASTFPGRDTAWVAANNNWTSTPYVKGQGGQNVRVAGSTQAAVGASICRSGSTTGWHCGTIQQHNTSVTYPQGTVSGVTRTSVCAEPGDSGGSFISGSQAQGVTSGGSGNCSSGGTTFYQPINPLLQGYGLTLKTGTSGSEDPGPSEPGETTWAAGTVYEAGAQVTYDGITYRCLQGHQAQPGWEPANTPSLWEQV
ncbi:MULTISPECIES: carbohydrate-binding protein [Streptomyces]|uniref:S1 family peptidase n=2 Tax=Streptomyces rimosus subsp. rimosus TaxID=132474 RepID=L8EQT9_STRR1|nr:MULTISPECIES: carbohydrate-binding protein [Streptomyces]KOG80104.1 serine protease [Kitasatospora aureofaciens]MYT41129.1 S1 family peptidase [Streptomyces sp. SID5471]KEF08382.1 serine protease [Streptomyces rimosus]KEF20666.1 serine protease [Streptomyces rimosus]KOT26353.1 serine protease [Streptomyces rimosus subsp. rimosus]